MDRLLELTRYSRVEQNDRMHVAVARVENVRDRQSAIACHTADVTQCFGDACSRNNAVLDVVGRADAPDRAEGVLPAFPEQVALLGGLGDAELPRPAGKARVADLLGLFL